MVKNRWHVPLQVLATALAVVGFFLGHYHKGREFLPNNVHAKFANLLYLQMFVQIGLGFYLKLHLEKGFHGRIRPIFRVMHGVNGKAFPLASWVQMVFGGITALGFCQSDHLGQCLAHFIMGSAFIAYGILLTILLLVGQLWLKRTGRSQEFFDSAMIAAWGCVNTFTEHRWGSAWIRNDWQHTTMGIIWWSAGLAGVWLSRSRDGRPQRNFIPGFVLLMTGWAMSSHPQDLPISAMTHKIFGYTLMAAGLTRIIEISFILRDRGAVSDDGFETNSFQYIPVFVSLAFIIQPAKPVPLLILVQLLYASGILFMGATEEQMHLVAEVGIDHVAYILILYSLAFLMFLFVLMLIRLYDCNANAPKRVNSAADSRPGYSGVRLPEDGQLRDAQEFELDGLMTDDEEDEESAARRKLIKEDAGEDENGLGSPSTIGRNSDRVALP